MSNARSKLDVIYEDVLGDVGELVTRIESSTKVLNKVHEQSNKDVERIRDLLEITVDGASSRLKSELNATTVELLNEVKQAKQEVLQATAIVNQSTTKLATYTILIGLAAGIVGGALATLAFIKLF